MAKLRPGVEFTGKIGNLSAYRMQGVEGIILRSPGGITKSQYKRSKTLDRLRENATEFGVATQSASLIRRAITPVWELTDHNYTPRLNAITRHIQQSDDKGARGQRGIYISRFGSLLNGFSLNREHSFDSVVSSPIHCHTERASGKVTVQLPTLVPGINLSIPWKCKQYRFLVGLGLVSDQEMIAGRTYGKTIAVEDATPKTYTGNWVELKASFPGETVSLQLVKPEQLIDGISMIVSVGIEVELTYSRKLKRQVLYTGGAGRILELG